MPISISQPIVIPATEAKTFDSWWISRINIVAYSPKIKGRAEIDVVPYNTETQEVLLSKPRRIVINDLWGTINENQKVAGAMQAIIEAVDDLIQTNGLPEPQISPLLQRPQQNV